MYSQPKHLTHKLILFVQITRGRVDFNRDSTAKSPCRHEPVTFQPSPIAIFFSPGNHDAAVPDFQGGAFLSSAFDRRHPQARPVLGDRNHDRQFRFRFHDRPEAGSPKPDLDAERADQLSPGGDFCHLSELGHPGHRRVRVCQASQLLPSLSSGHRVFVRSLPGAQDPQDHDDRRPESCRVHQRLSLCEPGCRSASRRRCDHQKAR